MNKQGVQGVKIVCFYTYWVCVDKLQVVIEMVVVLGGVLITPSLSQLSYMPCTLQATHHLSKTVLFFVTFYVIVLHPPPSINPHKNNAINTQTSPFWWYFISALPRALLGSLPLVFWGVYRDRRSWVFLTPAVGFVALYSFLPHKELRFIVYSIPLFNLVAALGYSNM